MRKQFYAQLAAIRQVLLFMKSHQGQYAQLPALVQGVEELEQLMEQVQNLMVKMEGIPRKTAGNKKQARMELVELAHPLGAMVKAFAFIMRNGNLFSLFTVSRSTLAHRMQYSELLSYAKVLHEQISLYGEELQAYGYNPSMGDELQSRTADYEMHLPEPRYLIGERKNSRKMALDLMAQIRRLLLYKIDPLMELFVQDIEFYRAYKSARMIVDPARRRRSAEKEKSAIVVEGE